MTEQETVDRFAALAKPRLLNLLRLRGARHIYNGSPGKVNSKIVEDGMELTLDKVKRAAQPYRDIERFISDARVMPCVIDPGLLPLVTSMSQAVLGRKLLVTRKVAARDSDKGVTAHVEGFGMRITMYWNEASADTIVQWECLYGVA